MTVKLQKRLIKVDEYHLMGEVGILGEKGIELIEGELIKMSPTGSKHASCVNRLNKLFNRLLVEEIVAVQNPIILDDFSEPEPDLAILKYQEDFYAKAHPTPQDVRLLIEVSDSTLDADREIKAPLYAKVGIPEYWIVNIEAQQIEVYYAPKLGNYQQKEIFEINDEVKAQFSAQITLKVKDVFG